MSGHQGDVHSISDENIGLFSQLNTSYGLGLRLPVGKVLGIRAEGTYFRLSGDEREYAERGHRARGWAFENKFVEASVLLDYRFRKDLTTLRETPRTVIPVVFAGIGVMFGNPDVNFRSGTPPAAAIDLAAGDDPQLTLPVGLGLHYVLSNKFTLAFETAFRLPVSDYYDGISVTANPNANDVFAFAGMKVYYKFREEPDGDADGVPDKEDDCPETPGAERFNGCPDSDLDGVMDKNDNCPLEVGPPELAGCPDNDRDGIINRLDGCPDAAGELKNRGCPDTDGDGVVDIEDDCPKISGLIELAGCPDADLDGVADAEDECPTEKGTMRSRGCPPIDSSAVDSTATVIATAEEPTANNDSTVTTTTIDTTVVVTTITPPLDSTIAVVDNAEEDSNNQRDQNDAPISQNPTRTDTAQVDIPTVQQKLTRLATDIKFNTASFTLSNTAKTSLTDVVELLRANPSLQLSINGYTDNVGSATANQRLSEKRAQATYDYLMEQGVAARQLQYRGFGEDSPIADNATAAGRYRNRRVELTLITNNRRSVTSPTTSEVAPKNIVSYGAVASNCSGHPIFNLPVNQAPRVLTRLGTNPEFGDSHGLNGAGFYRKLQRAYTNSERDRVFLDAIFRAMDYPNGFAEATPDLFTEVILPYGTEGNIGYSINHKTLFAKLNVSSDRDLRAFRIRSANGCDLHFMKTCGNHMFF